jgi:hypothetical protein
VSKCKILVTANQKHLLEKVKNVFFRQLFVFIGGYDFQNLATYVSGTVLSIGSILPYDIHTRY